MGDLLIVDTGGSQKQCHLLKIQVKRFEAKEVYIPNGDNEFAFSCEILQEVQSSFTVVRTSRGNLREHFQKEKRGPRCMSRF